MNILDQEELQSLQSQEQVSLLDTIDELRRHGVSRYVSLPQLIVCGDQSSGKSSVLEAISGVQFPVNDGLCTRFTTEVILRRANQKLAAVKLATVNHEHVSKLSLFERSSINHAEIPDLISEAKTYMGLTGSSSFSRDILQLEISGPNLPHLTLVDLPGLIHHPNKEQTKEDARIPTELAKRYMKEPRSIVLAIVTAKNDTSNQVVLKLAQEADPGGVRTMGIITKPDALIKDSPSEASFFTLASNKETQFKLDWHVLRNGDYNERNDSTFDRDTVEKEFFDSTIWHNLPSYKRGVEALRKRLSHVLYKQILKELPGLLQQVELELTNCRSTLERLGSPRNTPGERRKYLTRIVQRYHYLVCAGSQGEYRDPYFRGTFDGLESDFTTQNRRLRAKIREEEQNFVDQMCQKGHTHTIQFEEFNHPKSARVKSLDDKKPETVDEENFLQKIRTLLNNSKGRELPGTFSHCWWVIYLSINPKIGNHWQWNSLKELGILSKSF